MMNRYYRNIRVHLCLFIMLMSGVFFWGCQSAAPVRPVGSITFPGLAKAALTPELFAPNLVSTALAENSCPQFSRDGRLLIYGAGAGDTQGVILIVTNNSGHWSKPVVAPFSGRYNDRLPVLSPDGRQLYFRSNRPETGSGAPLTFLNNWVIRRGNSGWGQPKRFPECDGFSVTSVAVDGALYCHSALGGEGGDDLFMIPRQASGFGEPINLGDRVNSVGNESRPSISPDGQILLFQASGRPGGEGPMVSFRETNGDWCEPRRLALVYGADGSDGDPGFGPNGDVLFLISRRFRDQAFRDLPRTYNEILDFQRGPMNLLTDIYWLSAEVLAPLRPGGPFDLQGDYLGQEPPGLTPRVFAPAVVSTGIHEHSGANFSVDGNHLFYTAAGATNHTILHMQRRDDRWSYPEVAPFSGFYRDDNAHFSADGQRLYFDSRRPDAGEIRFTDWRVWSVEQTDSGWGEPVLEEALSALKPLTPSYARNGNVYFARREENNPGNLDLYMAEANGDGTYGDPVPLGPAVNSPGFEAWHYVHPDEIYLIFSSYGRATGPGLYISFRNEQGDWQPAVWMGSAINGGGQSRMPRLSPDGKYLFYNHASERHGTVSDEMLTFDDLINRAVSSQNGNGDIWWVSAAVIDSMRQIEIPDIRQALFEVAASEGVDSARLLYERLKQRHPDYYDFSGDLLNAVGYRLLGAGKHLEAIGLFKLNTEVFPDDANGFDSLGEAKLAVGDSTGAAESYRQALRLNPTLPSAINVMQRLKIAGKH